MEEGHHRTRRTRRSQSRARRTACSRAQRPRSCRSHRCIPGRHHRRLIPLLAAMTSSRRGGAVNRVRAQATHGTNEAVTLGRVFTQYRQKTGTFATTAEESPISIRYDAHGCRRRRLAMKCDTLGLTRAATALTHYTGHTSPAHLQAPDH